MGYVHVYTGDGKGKTTAALGLILRALGAGSRVILIQFLKKGNFSEIKALRSFGDQITIFQFGSGGFVKGKPGDKDEVLVLSGMKEAARAVKENLFDLVVLDEANCAMKLGLIEIGDIISLIKRLPKGMELVLTGRDAPYEIIEAADLVTEMRMVKHYFQKGIKAREGIEM
jgi:cob(I)alamin adenosyltransferase